MRGLLLAAVLGAPCWAAPFADLLDLPSDYSSHRVTRLAALEANQTATLFEADGPGAVTHIWMTLEQNEPRRLVLRMYWDDEAEPSVEAPLADFFGVGHNHLEPETYFATPCLAVAPKNGYNVYFPMPFRSRARITITNEQNKALNEGGGLYFQADYVRFAELAAGTPYFRAQWRREAPAARRARPYTILQTAGNGFIAGVTLHVRADDASDKWFHGGGDLLLTDGESVPKVIKGIGGEDFFGESWSSSTFVSPYAGCTNERNGEISLYRFFLEGPPRFRSSAWLGFGAMENEMTSVVYWYQSGPLERFTELPAVEERLPKSPLSPGRYDRRLRAGDQVPVAIIGPFLGDIDFAIPLDGMAEIDTRVGLLTNYFRPYKDIVPDANNRQVRWERTETELQWIDFDAAYKPKMTGPRGVQAMPDALAYACLRFDAAEARAVELLVGHDDAVRVWLNGAEAAALPALPEFGGERVTLNARAGTNTLLIKVANDWNSNWGAFVLSLYFPDKTGLSFHDFQELPPVFGE